MAFGNKLMENEVNNHFYRPLREDTSRVRGITEEQGI